MNNNIIPTGKDPHDVGFCDHLLEPTDVRRSKGSNIQCKECTHLEHQVACSMGRVSCGEAMCPAFGQLRDVLVKADRRFDK